MDIVRCKIPCSRRGVEKDGLANAVTSRCAVAPQATIENMNPAHTGASFEEKSRLGRYPNRKLIKIDRGPKGEPPDCNWASEG